MPIDPARALAAAPRETRISWTRKDVLLYHLGIGAGRPATDPAELRYVLEDRLRVLPSFATVAGDGGVAGEGAGLDAPGVDVDLAAVLHGAQRVDVHRPLPPAGEAARTSRIAAVYDKGKAAVLVLRTEAADGDGPLWTSDTQLYVRGEGGFGGERGPSPRLPDPQGPPAYVADRAVREDQALLYRLSGDWNPLHADPEFAALAGFDRPILHGLCSYGMALKAAVDTVLDGDPGRVRAYATRFAGVVHPGETLRIRMWPEQAEPAGSGESAGGGRIRLTAGAVERDEAPVLADTVIDHD